MKKDWIAVANGTKEPDLVIRNASIVNVFSNTMQKGDIAIKDGMIVGIGEYEAENMIDAGEKVICPGLIDGHVHIESSMVSPFEFAKTLLLHGVTAVAADPHEIANVLGTAGIDYMLEASKDLPVDIFFTLPSCVPAGPLDESGAILKAKDLRPYYENKRIVGLAEMMAYPQTVTAEDSVLEKIEDAFSYGKTVDGHAPFLSGKSLNAYCAAGVSSDHECTDFKEALEKLECGQWIMIREGTAAPNFDALRDLCEEPYYQRCMFVTDDRHPDDLRDRGSIDFIIRKAIKAGVSPIHAIRMGSFHAAQYFGLKDRGAIAPGYRADILICSDLECLDKMEIETVIKDGKIVVQDGKTVLFPKNVTKPCPSFHLEKVEKENFFLEKTGNKQRIITLLPHQILTEEEIIPLLECKGEELGVCVEKDILKIAVLERHHHTGHIANGFLKGYGLKNGAVATSVSHDSHNLIVVGTNSEDMAAAANAVRESEGGIAFAVNGKIAGVLALPIAGLMSDAPIDEVIEKLEHIYKEVSSCGMKEGIDPFMTLAFAALSVIPKCRINSLGVIDVLKGRHVPAIF